MSTAQPLGPAEVDHLFGSTLTYSFTRAMISRVNGIGRHAMWKSLDRLDTPADIRQDAQRVMNLPRYDHRTLDGVHAVDLPFVLHFALDGILTLKRNGRVLNPAELHALVQGATGRANEVLIALGRASAYRSACFDFAAAIGVTCRTLAL